MSSNPILFVKKNETSFPTKKSGDAWYDLSAHIPESITLTPWQRHVIPTNLFITIPDGYYGRVAPRSGLAYKYGIDVLAWVIDSSYTWEIWVILINLGQEDFTINNGDRIAQLVIEKIATDIDVRYVDDLEASHRNEWGFGSTGV